MAGDRGHWWGQWLLERRTQALGVTLPSRQPYRDHRQKCMEERIKVLEFGVILTMELLQFWLKYPGPELCVVGSVVA